MQFGCGLYYLDKLECRPDLSCFCQNCREMDERSYEMELKEQKNFVTILHREIEGFRRTITEMEYRFNQKAEQSSNVIEHLTETVNSRQEALREMERNYYELTSTFCGLKMEKNRLQKDYEKRKLCLPF